ERRAYRDGGECVEADQLETHVAVAPVAAVALCAPTLVGTASAAMPHVPESITAEAAPTIARPENPLRWLR
ncbi:MAG: hypothetical protein ABIO49_06750, partial [Dokdonella sp.]